MGLSICFDLSLPAGTPDSDVFAMLRRLRETARTLPFHRPSRVVRLGARELDGPSPMRGLAFERLVDVVNVYGRISRTQLLAERLGLDEDARVDVPAGLPTTVIGFAVGPGSRSEPAAFGLARLDGGDTPSRWSWWCCCKTQYASVLGDEHLIKCHTAVISLLDAAKQIGFECDVRDETGYFRSRDTNDLVSRVAEMNRIVARLGGAFSDAFAKAGGDTKQIQGEIFRHPDFERLETPRSS